MNKGDILAVIHSDDLDKGTGVSEKLKGTIKIGDKNKEKKKLIYGVISKGNKTLH